MSHETSLNDEKRDSNRRALERLLDRTFSGEHVAMQS